MQYDRIIGKTLQFLLLVAVQVLVLNQINLFGYVTPMLYILFTIKYRSNTNRSLILLLSFLLGLSVDLFSGTPGMHSAAITLVAFLQPIVMRLFISYDRRDVVIPSISSMHFVPFVGYVSALTLIHHLFYFLLKSIPVSDFSLLLAEVSLSMLLTVIIIVVLDISFAREPNRHTGW